MDIIYTPKMKPMLPEIIEAPVSLGQNGSDPEDGLKP
jgi:hypothetical protein